MWYIHFQCLEYWFWFVLIIYWTPTHRTRNWHVHAYKILIKWHYTMKSHMLWKKCVSDTVTHFWSEVSVLQSLLLLKKWNCFLYGLVFDSWLVHFALIYIIIVLFGIGVKIYVEFYFYINFVFRIKKDIQTQFHFIQTQFYLNQFNKIMKLLSDNVCHMSNQKHIHSLF